MVIITKEEKNLIREKFPNVHIVRTMKNRSKRHRYYMEERQEPMKMLRALRGHALMGNSSIEGMNMQS